MRPTTIGALSLSACSALAVFTISMQAAAQDGPFADGETVAVAPFDSVVLAGGGEITIMPGETQSVRIISGGDAVRLEVDDDTLKVECKKPCPRNTDIDVAVTTDELEAIVLAGGGDIRIDGEFSPREEFTVVITGGGDIDAFGAPADEVEVVITGGGDISVSAAEELDVSIIGGGTIRYRGDPAINRSILGGGTITRD